MQHNLQRHRTKDKRAAVRGVQGEHIDFPSACAQLFNNVLIFIKNERRKASRNVMARNGLGSLNCGG